MCNNNLTPDQKHAKKMERLFKDKAYVDNQRNVNNAKRNVWNAAVRAKLKAGIIFNDGKQFFKFFNNDDVCEQYLIDLFFKDANGNDAFTCRHCGVVNARVWKLAGYQFECLECGERFNVLTNTPFEGCRTGLLSWFYSIYFENVLVGGVTSGELEKLSGVGRTTALNRLHSIRRYGYFQDCFPKVVFKDGEGNDIPLVYKVENMGLVFSLDVMVRDGNNISRRIKNKRGYRGGKNKQYVLVIAQENGKARAYTVTSEDTDGLIPTILEHIPRGATVYTDQAPVFKQLKKVYGYDLRCINHKNKEYGRIEDGKMITTNTVEGFHSFFQTGLGKFRNSISKEYTFEYLNAAIFRYNTGLMCEEDKFNFVLKNIFEYAIKETNNKQVTIKTIRKRKATDNNKFKQARTFFAEQKRAKKIELAGSEVIAA